MLQSKQGNLKRSNAINLPRQGYTCPASCNLFAACKGASRASQQRPGLLGPSLTVTHPPFFLSLACLCHIEPSPQDPPLKNRRATAAQDLLSSSARSNRSSSTNPFAKTSHQPPISPLRGKKKPPKKGKYTPPHLWNGYYLPMVKITSEVFVRQKKPQVWGAWDTTVVAHLSHSNAFEMGSDKEGFRRADVLLSSHLIDRRHKSGQGDRSKTLATLILVPSSRNELARCAGPDSLLAQASPERWPLSVIRERHHGLRATIRLPQVPEALTLSSSQGTKKKIQPNHDTKHAPRKTKQREKGKKNEPSLKSRAYLTRIPCLPFRGGCALTRSNLARIDNFDSPCARSPRTSTPRRGNVPDRPYQLDDQLPSRPPFIQASAIGNM